MTELLEKAIAEVSKLSGEEQDRLARLLLLELEDQRAWDQSFASTQDQLASLADEAAEEHAAGRSRVIGDELEVPRN